MPEDQILLTFPDPVKRKYCRLGRVGSRLTRASWAGSGKARESAVDFYTEDGARDALAAEVDKRLGRGFVIVRERDAVAPGEAVLECLVGPNRYLHGVDLHPDGGTLLAVIGLRDESATEICLIDVATGLRRLVHSIPGSGVRHRSKVHATYFEHDGSGVVYLLEKEVWRLDLATGASRLLVSCQDGFAVGSARHGFDGSHRRLLLMEYTGWLSNTGSLSGRARVVDAGGATLFEVSTESPTHYGAGALSSSGRRLALFRVDRGTLDKPHELEIWDVDRRRLVQRIPVSDHFGNIDFDPSETLLIGDVSAGLRAISLESGDLAWTFPDEDRSEWSPLHLWRYSADGRFLATGCETVDLFTAADREPSGVRLRGNGGWRNQWFHDLAFSDDGSLVAAGSDGRRITVHKL
ncbi:WD40 repeat domain-containing protein [Plantactinospora sp. ZYX-F-223]|uniref:WD40 repeat domain-containing protein n=1 Tax=Plantactinospora sp. ZYX-F-223 TaxID=3144103 RepID=UPI0031FDA592